MDLHGKTAVVTGANGFLGHAVVSCLLANKGRVIALDVRFDEAPADGVRQEVIDLADKQATDELFQRLGPIHVLCNLAGGFAMGDSAYEIASPQWDAMFKVNVATTQNAIHAAMPIFLAQGRGSIVNIGAMSAREGQANMSAYCAAKSVVMRLTESLSKEVRANGVNVNAVLPSIIDTPRNRQDMPEADFSRWVRPEDLAKVICFLASEAAVAIHGALIPVTGLS